MTDLDRTRTVHDVSATETRILDAASELFLVHGFSSVSTDRLSKEAGVSKTSIYKYFGDMAGIFSAVVQRQGDLYELGFENFPGSETEFWDELIAFGTRLLTLLNGDFCIQFDRMLHEVNRTQPELMKRFYDLAYGRGHVEITKMLMHGKVSGFITKAQSAEALADNLICMWEGLGQVKARLGVTDHSCADPSGWARQCVETLFEIDFARGSQRA